MKTCGGTWAATHISTSAKSTLRACAPTRPGAWKAALWRVAKPSTRRQATTANSGASILAVSRSKTRLIIGFVLLRRRSGFSRLVGRLAEGGRGSRRLVGAFGGRVHRFRRLVDSLAEQVVVEHLACDRRRRACSKTGVLHQHGERDPRILRGSERDEKSVVAQMLEDRRLRVFFALLERHDLSGARLAGAHVARAGERARCRAFLVDPDHGVLHDFQIPGLERYGLGSLGLHVSALARDRVLNIVDEMGAE